MKLNVHVFLFPLFFSLIFYLLVPSSRLMSLDVRIKYLLMSTNTITSGNIMMNTYGFTTPAMMTIPMINSVSCKTPIGK